MALITLGNSKPYRINYILLIVSVILIVFIVSSCHKKVGVKPGGQLKKKEDKCLCKKKKGLYSDGLGHKSAYQFDNYTAIIASKTILDV